MYLIIGAREPNIAGYHLGDNAMWGKHTNYEATTRIPMMFHIPGVTSPDSDFRYIDVLAGNLTHTAQRPTPVQPRLRTDALVEAVDLYPTLAELAGLMNLVSLVLYIIV